MKLNVKKLDSVYEITINEFVIPNISGYKIKTSDSGKTEVLLKIKIDSPITEVSLSAS